MEDMNGYLVVRTATAILIFLIIIILIHVMLKRGKDGTYQKPDYLFFLIFGFILCLLGVGFLINQFAGVNLFIGLILLASGLVQIAFALVNKDKWRTPQEEDHQE